MRTPLLSNLTPPEAPHWTPRPSMDSVVRTVSELPGPGVCRIPRVPRTGPTHWCPSVQTEVRGVGADVPVTHRSRHVSHGPQLSFESRPRPRVVCRRRTLKVRPKMFSGTPVSPQCAPWPRVSRSSVAPTSSRAGLRPGLDLGGPVDGRSEDSVVLSLTRPRSSYLDLERGSRDDRSDRTGSSATPRT